MNFSYKKLKVEARTLISVIFLVSVISLGFFSSILIPEANAQKSNDSYNFKKDSGLSVTGGEAGYNEALTPQPEEIVGQVIQAILSILGIIFLAFMVYAGITWMTAQGDEQKAMKAKKIIEEAIVGLILVIIAYAITYFVINYFATQNVISN